MVLDVKICQVKNVAVAVIALLVLMVVFFGITGPMKVFTHPHMVREFERFGYPYWLARVAGTSEILSVAILLAGFFQPAYFAIGSLLLACVMAGAACINFIKRPPAFGIGTLVLLALCLVPAFYYYNALAALLNSQA